MAISAYNPYKLLGIGSTTLVAGEEGHLAAVKKFIEEGGNPTDLLRELVSTNYSTDAAIEFLMDNNADPFSEDGALTPSANLCSEKYRRTLEKKCLDRLLLVDNPVSHCRPAGSKMWDLLHSMDNFGMLDPDTLINHPGLKKLDVAYSFLLDRFGEQPTGDFVLIGCFEGEKGEAYWNALMNRFNEYFHPDNWKGREKEAIAEYEAFLKQTPDRLKDAFQVDVDITEIRRAIIPAPPSEGIKRFLKPRGQTPDEPIKR